MNNCLWRRKYRPFGNPHVIATCVPNCDPRIMTCWHHPTESCSAPCAEPSSIFPASYEELSVKPETSERRDSRTEHSANGGTGLPLRSICRRHVMCFSPSGYPAPPSHSSHRSPSRAFCTDRVLASEGLLSRINFRFIRNTNMHPR